MVPTGEVADPHCCLEAQYATPSRRLRLSQRLNQPHRLLDFIERDTPSGPVKNRATGGDRRRSWTDTGGEGSITQWVHGEFIVISEAIRSHFTHQAHGKHF